RRHTRSKRDWSSDVCSSDLSQMTLWTRVRKLADSTQLGSTRFVTRPELTRLVLSSTNGNIITIGYVVQFGSIGRRDANTQICVRSEERRVGGGGRRREWGGG